MNKLLAAVRLRLNRLFSDPLRLVPLGYAFYVVIGWVVLALPICHRNSPASALDDLFTAMSAVSTTGLVTIPTGASYSGGGQAVILLLIQLGGLGYMTLGSFTVMSITGRLPPLRERIGATAFSLPAGATVREFIRVVVAFTLVIEALGAAALVPVFAAHGVPDPAWQAIFHSVSAFCTAGFGLFADSLEGYRDDVWLNLIIGGLSYLGAIGFIVLSDCWAFARGRKAGLTLTSKIILLGTLGITAGGTVLLALGEPSAVPAGQRWMDAWFQVMSASTTVGFNTIPIATLPAGSLFLLTVVMMIGASPSGTGGGIKTTTLTALWSVVLSVARRRSQVTFLGLEVPDHRVRAAVANATFYTFTLAAGLYGLAVLETAPLPDLMFECASALGTVGLSRGITAALSPSGELVLIALMFLGRVGPLALGMALVARGGEGPARAPQDDVVV